VGFPFRPALRAAGATVGPTLAAFALRAWPLAGTGTRFPWLTFYPAVVAAATLAGLWAGVAASILSALAVQFLWPIVLGARPIKDSADVVGMAVFAFNGLLISGLAEAMHRAQRRALLARRKAEEANQAKSIFLANMSHELRTPLNAVLGFSALLRREPDITPERAAHLDVITRSGEHLLSLIDAVLDMAKIESGRAVLDESSVSVHELIRDVEVLLSPQAAEKGLTLTSNCGPDIPRALRADATRLRQVLINLVGNAIKYTDAGTVSLSATLRGTAADGRVRVRIEVTDTGPGLTVEEQSRVFAPFVQLSRAGRVASGCGLGLAISRQNVELMGGRIGVVSKPGEGSVFFAETPFTVAHDAVRSTDGDRGPVTGLVDGRPALTVLIADDAADNRRLLRCMLEPLGCDVREVDNGADAVREATAWQPEVVLMDVRMPVMDGLEATRRIRDVAGARRPVMIGLTAHALDDERRAVVAAGCDGCLGKPLREDDLFDAIERHLGGRFVRADVACPPDSTTTLLPPGAEEFAVLEPEEMRALAEAVESLDRDECTDAIERIRSSHPDLAVRLEMMVRDIRFKELLVALDEAGAARR
jgi:signal transduction histidine kinase/CheY-like chemotaxis protein